MQFILNGKNETVFKMQLIDWVFLQVFVDVSMDAAPISETQFFSESKLVIWIYSRVTIFSFLLPNYLLCELWYKIIPDLNYLI